MLVLVAEGILGAVTAAAWVYWLIFPSGPIENEVLVFLELLWVAVNVALDNNKTRALMKRR